MVTQGEQLTALPRISKETICERQPVTHSRFEKRTHYMRTCRSHKDFFEIVADNFLKTLFPKLSVANMDGVVKNVIKFLDTYGEQLTSLPRISKETACELSLRTALYSDMYFFEFVG